MANRWGNNGNSDRLYFLGLQNHSRWWLQSWNQDTFSLEKSYDQPRQRIQKQRHYFADKDPSSQSYGFSSSHVWMWELDYKESWAPKNWCFWTVVLEKTLESPLDSQELKPVNPKSVLNIRWKDWCWGWNSNTLATWCDELTPWKRLWCWESPSAGEEGDNGGWDGWMASPTWWTWVWTSSGSWWWTGEPGMLQSMELQSLTWPSDWTGLTEIDNTAAAAAKVLQLCPTLCDPIDGSPPGSPVPEILQARILQWVAISFSNAWKWKVKVKSFSHVWLFTTPWTAAYQAPPSMGFSRQEYWSGVPLPSPIDNTSHLQLPCHPSITFCEHSISVMVTSQVP